MASRFWPVAVLCTWLMAVLGYWGVLVAHSLTPGVERPPPPLDAVDGSLRGVNSNYLLVMAVHPKCPCTRATAEEFAKLNARYRDQLQCVVLVYRPQAESSVWAETGTTAALDQQPNTRLVIDVDGQQAFSLGMSTSGAVILYSPDGEPRYWGGITSARGHSGDNLGSDSIAAILSARQPAATSQPVFGCHIQSEFERGGD